MIEGSPTGQTPDPCVRLFVAIPVPAAVRTGLADAGRELAAALRGATVSWTRPENLHVTLRFLGDVPCSDLDALAESLANATHDFGPLPLACERLGTFPHLRRPRVVWTWVHDTGADDRLADLARRITAATAPFTQEPAETRFTGHVTIGRIRQIQRADVTVLGERLERAATRLFGSWMADRVELVRSELSPGGSRYTTLREFPFSERS